VGEEGARRLAAGRLGRVLELVAAPDGRALAVASHDGRVLLVDADSGDVRQVDHSEHGDASGLSFSPDSRWLAWSRPGPGHLRQIRMARVDGDGQPTLVDATPLRFVDTEPVFTLDGRHLAFLSARTFDPVYDEHVFDMSFPAAVRPHLLPLAATTPSPFDPELHGRAVGGPTTSDGDGGGSGTPGGSGEPPEVVVDVEGMDQRVVPVPVPAGRYHGLQAARDGLLWLRNPLLGVLGSAQGPGEATRPRLQRYDLRTRRLVTLVDAADDAAVSGDGRWVVYSDGPDLRVVPADRRVDSSDDDNESTVDVDLTRLRVWLDPAAEWRQMYDEAGRLMRDHFWVADMSGVDWEGVLARYRPLLDRIGSRDDLSELLWEVQGELNTSHAYEMAPSRPVDHTRRVGRLGADLVRDADGNWRIARIVPGESSAPAARSPLLAPGVALRPGDVIVAVDGRPVDPVAGPAPLLVGAAGVPVELTVRRDADGGGVRRVVVEPLADEMPLRYHDWVAGRRAAVHAATDGRVGYLHIPDMLAEGWAQLHRDLHLEVEREALVVDVRDNSGGHVSELVLEKLARRVRGWCVVRHKSLRTYPENAVRGPIVVVTNEIAGSDGDIVTAVFKTLGLGPVVGMRTWGGVIGIDSRYHLVDGTLVTQPRYSHHFEGFGWGIENHGVDPDVEVPFAPHDWAAGADPQLDTAVRLVLEALRERPASTPPDVATRPDRAAPVLPPRSVRP
jgi:tricorn protease